VMIHHDAHGKPPAYDMPYLPQVGAPGWTPLEIRRWKVRSRWLDMNENAVDQAHFRCMRERQRRMWPSISTCVVGVVLVPCTKRKCA